MHRPVWPLGKAEPLPNHLMSYLRLFHDCIGHTHLMKLPHRLTQKYPLVAAVIRRIHGKELLYVANDISFKLLLSSFPMLIFLLTLLGFFEIDYQIMLSGLSQWIPTDVINLVETMSQEVMNVRRPELLSIALATTLYSSTAGMRRLIVGIKKAYGEEESRPWLKAYAHSFLLVFVFVGSVVLGTVGMVFGGHVLNLLELLVPGFNAGFLLRRLPIALGLVVMLLGVMASHRIALDRRVRFIDVLPGAVFTLWVWGIAGFSYNLYVSVFTDMWVYGSLAGMAVFMIWLNLICNVILVGAALNKELDIRRRVKQIRQHGTTQDWGYML